jgi:hypothetical protein
MPPSYRKKFPKIFLAEVAMTQALQGGDLLGQLTDSGEHPVRVRLGVAAPGAANLRLFCRSFARKSALPAPEVKLVVAEFATHLESIL